jgi:uncharacterized RDD family membrane protein YckC
VHDDDLPPTTPVPEQVPVNTLASIGRRLAARLLDGVVLLPVWILLLSAFGADLDGGIADVPEAAVRCLWLVAVAYEIVLVARTGQTLGKRWMRIKVVDGTTGANPDWDQAGRRAAPALLQIVPLVGAFAGLLYLPALWRPRRQGLHDRLANTVVVNV